MSNNDNMNCINAIWETITIEDVSATEDPIKNIEMIVTRLVEDELKKIKKDEFENIIDSNLESFHQANECDGLIRCLGLLSIYKEIVDHLVKKEL